MALAPPEAAHPPAQPGTHMAADPDPILDAGGIPIEEAVLTQAPGLTTPQVATILK